MQVTRTLTLLFTALTLLAGHAQAQIRINSRAIDAIGKGVKAGAFSDADAARLAREGVTWMDKNNPVAGPTDPYAKRLDKLFGKHKSESGLTLNYKVYKVVDVNAFACADGSVRVFSALMDLMTDDELLAVIGHEIGHVYNHDSRDAVKAAYKRAAITEAAASQSSTVYSLSNSELGSFAGALVDAKYNRKQETAADDFGYEFLKKNSYDVMGMASAFRKLAKLSEGGPQQSKTEKMFSSHPDSEKRADRVIEQAKKDGLYKESQSK